MRRIDYDTEQYQDYARGRALTGPQRQAWIDAFAAVLPEQIGRASCRERVSSKV